MAGGVTGLSDHQGRMINHLNAEGEAAKAIQKESVENQADQMMFKSTKTVMDGTKEIL